MTARAPSEQHTRAAPIGVRAAWLTVDQAAAILNTPVVTLRRTLERNSRRGPNAGTIARVDGITARKLGRHWRVWLDPEWLSPSAIEVVEKTKESAAKLVVVAPREQPALDLEEAIAGSRRLGRGEAFVAAATRA
jgi:hypothetical protein